MIVRDLPSPEEDEEPEVPEQAPRAIILPAGQSARDRDAFIRWIDDHWGGYIQKRLLCRGDIVAESTKDLHQRVLIVLCEQYEKHGAPEHVMNFLERVIQNEVCNHKRRWRPEVATDAEAEAEAVVASGPSPESAAELLQRREKLRRYLDLLPTEEAALVRDKDLQEQTFDEIAAALGRPLPTVAKQHARALRRLQEMIPESQRPTELGERRRK